MPTRSHPVPSTIGDRHCSHATALRGFSDRGRTIDPSSPSVHEIANVFANGSSRPGEGTRVWEHVKQGLIPIVHLKIRRCRHRLDPLTPKHRHGASHVQGRGYEEHAIEAAAVHQARRASGILVRIGAPRFTKDRVLGHPPVSKKHFHGGRLLDARILPGLSASTGNDEGRLAGPVQSGRVPHPVRRVVEVRMDARRTCARIFLYVMPTTRIYWHADTPPTGVGADGRT